MATAEYPVAADEANKIMHVALPIGKNVLMGNDVQKRMDHVSEKSLGFILCDVQR